MGEEEPDNDPQEDLPEEPDELDDYQRPSDAPSVTHELGSSLRELTLRLAVTGIVTVLLLALEMCIRDRSMALPASKMRATFA